MAYSTSAELHGGPEDGRVIALPEHQPTLLVAQLETQLAAAAVRGAGIPSRLQTRHAAEYALNGHSACHRWQCATMNHHRYTYTGDQLR